VTRAVARLGPAIPPGNIFFFSFQRNIFSFLSSLLKREENMSQHRDRAGRLSVAVAVEHGLNITLKCPLLCVAWGFSTSVYKLHNRNVNASRNTLVHQE
jgi:hypothetical protein